MDKKTEKQIAAKLKECGKLKGAALREAYAQVVGRDTNETSRERLLNGIARVLYHDAEMAERAADETGKQDSKKAGKKARRTQSTTPDSVVDGAGSLTSNDGSADAADGATAGAVRAGLDGAVDRAGGAADAATGADVASGGPTGDGDGAGSADGTNEAKKRRVMRAHGERDPRLPPAGHVLKREYKGKVYEVTLLQTNGCLCDGQPYGSLSGFVKAVTGANHNGLLWFGLVKRGPKATAPAAGAQSE